MDRRPEILPSGSTDRVFEQPSCASDGQSIIFDEAAAASRIFGPGRGGDCVQRTDSEAGRHPDGAHGRNLGVGTTDGVRGGLAGGDRSEELGGAQLRRQRAYADAHDVPVPDGPGAPDGH